MGKEEIVLVDTSSWVEALRVDGNADVRQRVQTLMISGRAAWCDLIAVELWNGARGDYEKQQLRNLEKEITCLQATAEVWQTARNLARESRLAGKTVPASDLIIASCAIVHRARIEHCDNRINFILTVHKKHKPAQR